MELIILRFAPPRRQADDTVAMLTASSEQSHGNGFAPN